MPALFCQPVPGNLSLVPRHLVQPKLDAPLDPSTPVTDEPSSPPTIGHDPVLMRQVLDALFPPESSPKILVDCTLGRGGHALEIARRMDPTATLLAMDRDTKNLDFARSRLAPLIASGKNIRFFLANFAQLPLVLEAARVDYVDGILADLGVSTNQIFDSTYGLSFATDAPLDMRLSDEDPLTAYEIINRWREDDIADLIFHLADERYSRRIARKIVEARIGSPIQSTRRLADLVRQAVPHVSPGRTRKGPGRKGKGRSTESIDPATRTFLALRMKVNREAENLAVLLNHAPRVLASNGRLAVISFQSTEDRIVKEAFRAAHQLGSLEVLTRKPIVPDEDEIQTNPRSRSSKLRVARKPN